MGYKRTGRTNVDTQMGYGIGNNLFDIRYLTDENANLKMKVGLLWQIHFMMENDLV